MTKHSPDPKPERQLPLNEKVSRVIHNVADIAFADTSSDLERPVSPEVSAEGVMLLIQAWRERAHYLPGDLFSDPAWEMLLELLHAEIEQRPVSASALCTASTAPAGTANRWLKALEDRALAVRQPDPHDAAITFVRLTPRASTALRCYFRDIVQRQ